LTQIVLEIVPWRTAGLRAPGVIAGSGRMTLGSPGPGVAGLVVVVALVDVDSVAVVTIAGPVLQ
jgi:hypothetical protein